MTAKLREGAGSTEATYRKVQELVRAGAIAQEAIRAVAVREGRKPGTIANAYYVQKRKVDPPAKTGRPRAKAAPKPAKGSVRPPNGRAAFVGRSPGEILADAQAAAQAASAAQLEAAERLLQLEALLGVALELLAVQVAQLEQLEQLEADAAQWRALREHLSL